MTPAEFKTKWEKFSGKESAAYQEHFNDLCRMLGVPTPIEADPTGNDFFCFQKHVAKEAELLDFDATGGMPPGKKKSGFADVWKRDCFGWEYKGPGEVLAGAFKQLKQYRESLLNPPLLIVCDFHRYIIETNFNGTSPAEHKFTNDEIDSPRAQRLLREAFTDPERLRPGETTAVITAKLAEKIAAIALSLQGREAVELASAKTRKAHSVAQKKNLRIARFLNRLVFCFFAEDTGLLPENIFGEVCALGLKDPTHFAESLEDLFKCMAKGGRFGTHKIRHFNGHLFEDATVFELLPEEIKQLADTAKSDWQSIRPAIMGTLFERALDASQRSQLGAHYTSEEDIKILVEPVLMAPLRREWLEIRQALTPLLAKGKATTAARSTLAAFQKKLAGVTVLDPACGSGNFLYVALQLLLGLEKQIITAAAQIGFIFKPTVNVQQLRAIEINPYAYELAQVSVQIGALQWRRDNGFDNDRSPVLQNLDGFENKDALLNETFRKKPKNLKAAQAEEHGREDELFKVYTERAWPACDVIVGNPPFLGDKFMRGELGGDYVEQLRKIFGKRIPGQSDLCCYWFEKARQQIEDGNCKRAGLLATQGIRGGANREVLKRIKETGDIFFAESDRKWILAGANVHVSMVGFDDGAEKERTLDTRGVVTINANLSANADIQSAQVLQANAGRGFIGATMHGPFEMDEATAIEMLHEPNPHGKPNSDVIRLWANGLSITKRFERLWVVDFAAYGKEKDAACFQAPFEYVKTRVKPVRDANRRDAYRVNWWVFGEARFGMRRACKNLAAFIGTPRVAKHRIFMRLNTAILPTDQIVVFAAENDFSFGVLHSRFHEVWALKLGTRLETRPRYTPTTCFETFPLPFADDTAEKDPLQFVAQLRAAHFHTWPDNLLREDPPRYAFPKTPDDHRAVISQAAAELNALRENWLNPPEWTTTRTLEFPGSTDGPWSRFIESGKRKADTGKEDVGVEAFNLSAIRNPQSEIGLVRYPITEPRDAECAAKLAKRTLTNLYNERPAWLANAHAKLDAAVAAAYGWPANLSDDEILSRLLELNLARAAAESKTTGAKKARTSREKGSDEML